MFRPVEKKASLVLVLLVPPTTSSPPEWSPLNYLLLTRKMFIEIFFFTLKFVNEPDDPNMFHNCFIF